mmetsp:Transcript_1576/g.2751  ORF Transcript_1576/g.2751 Transcript_1576/m.2751 type:complete len:217 (-) Transcript_1576:189-839(-)
MSDFLVVILGSCIIAGSHSAWKEENSLWGDIHAGPLLGMPVFLFAFQHTGQKTCSVLLLHAIIRSRTRQSRCSGFYLSPLLFLGACPLGRVGAAASKQLSCQGPCNIIAISQEISIKHVVFAKFFFFFVVMLLIVVPLLVIIFTSHCCCLGCGMDNCSIDQNSRNVAGKVFNHFADWGNRKRCSNDDQPIHFLPITFDFLSYIVAESLAKEGNGRF